MGISDKRDICKICINHLDSQHSAKKDFDHISLWRSRLNSELAKVKEHYEREKTALITLHRALQSELSARPIQTVEKNLDQEIVDEANEKKEEAWRYRGLAFGILSLIKHQHQEMREGKCRCGLYTTQCSTRLLLKDDPNRIANALHSWEIEQKKLIDSGRLNFRDVYIPRNHPMVTDSKWIPESFKIEKPK